MTKRLPFYLTAAYLCRGIIIMYNMNLLFSTLLIALSACGGNNVPDDITPTPQAEVKWTISPATVSFLSNGETKNVIVDANGEWTVKSNQSWCTTNPTQGSNGQTSLKITASGNHQTETRTAQLTFSSAKNSQTYTVSQEGAVIGDYVPEGYTLVWQDEFNTSRLSDGKSPLPDTGKWWFETGASGWGNNEIQNYIAGNRNTDTCAVISDGTLKIIAKKIGTEVLSIRMNSKESWKYGYFEARLRVPGGKGTWPAFWMLPKDFKNWPLDGEIDIMEYVGYDPNVVHATVHTQKYNHSIGTQVGTSTKISNAETEFHIYAVEWTAEYIKGFVDGNEYFHFNNDGKNDKETWPFNAPFYLKLNLAWGGNWGGAQGVDESKLPATYEIDFVRVYQR